MPCPAPPVRPCCPPNGPGSPGSLIVSFAGSYLRELGGWIAVADLIRCLEAVGVGEPAVRQALVRLKSRGFLAAERRSGDAGYELTEAGLQDLVTGDRRIFRPAAGHRRGRLGAGGLLGAGGRAATCGTNCAPSCPGWVSARSAPGSGSRRGRWPSPTRALLTAAGLDGYVTWFARAAPDRGRRRHLVGSGRRCGPVRPRS